MSRRVVRAFACWGALLGSLGPSLAPAQAPIQVMSGGGEIGVDGRGAWTTYASGLPSKSLEVATWFSLPLGGVVVHPRLLSWRATLRPEYRRTSYSGASEDLRGSGLAWSSGVQLFSGHPINLNLTGGRNRSVTEGGFGTRNELESSSLAAALTLRNQWFPMLLSWNRQRTSSEWSNQLSEIPLRTAFDTRSFRLSGTSSKTNLMVERILHEDREGVGDFRGWTVDLTHFLRWGKGSRLESSYELTDQAGLFGFDRRQWMERVRLQHTRAVATAWTWRQTTTETESQSSRLRTLTGDISAGLGRHVSAGFSASRDHTRFTEGTELSTLFLPRLAIDLPLAGKLRMTLGGAVGWQRRDLRGAADFTVPVVNESHQVTPSRRFTLDLPDADPTSIVVRPRDLSVLYQEGIDYLVAAEGATVRIDVPPGGRIQVGETVLVNYRARVDGNLDDEALVSDLNAQLSAGPLRLRQSYSTRDSRLPPTLSGGRGYGDYTNSNTMLDARVRTPLGTLLLDAGRLRRIRPDDRTRELSLGASLVDEGPGRVQTSIGAFYSETSTNEVDVTSLSGTASVSWIATRALRTRLALEALRWEENLVRRERFLGATMDLNWQLGLIETTLRLEVQRRVNSDSFSLNRVSLKSVRRF